MPRSGSRGARSRWGAPVVVAIAAVLPLGALGAIDLSFAGSVGSTPPRARSQQVDWRDEARTAASSVGDRVSEPLRRSGSARAVAPAVALAAAVAALLVVGIAIARWRPLDDLHPSLGAPRHVVTRGPPVCC